MTLHSIYAFVYEMGRCWELHYDFAHFGEDPATDQSVYAVPVGREWYGDVHEQIAAL